MASAFTYTNVTGAGLNLIAQATSSNPIVFTGAQAGDAALSWSSSIDWDAYSASKVDGTISGASASGATARIVASFGNAESDFRVYAVAIFARLASETGRGVCFAVLGKDSGTSSVVLPGASSPAQVTRFGFNIDFGASPTAVAVTETGALSVGDAARFVSSYAPGNPSKGVDESIRGKKTFKDDTTIEGWLTLKKTVYCQSNIYLGGTLSLGGAASRIALGINAVIVGSSKAVTVTMDRLVYDDGEGSLRRLLDGADVTPSLATISGGSVPASSGSVEASVPVGCMVQVMLPYTVHERAVGSGILPYGKTVGVNAREVPIAVLTRASTGAEWLPWTFTKLSPSDVFLPSGQYRLFCAIDSASYERGVGGKDWSIAPLLVQRIG